MKKKIALGLVAAMTLSMFAGCGQSNEADTTAETTEETTEAEEVVEEEPTVVEAELETYEGDGWSLQYDPTYFTANEGDDGSVVFAYYNEEITQAGSDYIMVSKLADTDYETVLTQKQEECDATDTEIIKSNFGADGVESYSFTKLYDASEDSGLQLYDAFTAIPVDSDVILIEYFMTMEEEEEDLMSITGAFETIGGTITVEGATSSDAASTDGYQTYEFDTYDGDTVVIDESNIESQEANDNASEWDGLPADAEIIAPGRDYNYYADADHYYILDTYNGLVTVASK